MKKKNVPKIIRQGNITIIIAHDPEGSFARKISDDIYFEEKNERAKESLRRCPLPDHILKPYIEQMRADEEKTRRIANTHISH
ncbi:MAG: hypothetical protein ABW007_06840 [Chitinophagaceae bacterium]